MTARDLHGLAQPCFIGSHSVRGICDRAQVRGALKLGWVKLVGPRLESGGGFVDLGVGMPGHGGHRPLLEELRSGLHGMDDNRILAFQIEDADLEQRAVDRGTDEHGELVIDELTDGVVHRVLDVVIGDSVSTRWLSNPHLDKISCLTSAVNMSCLGVGTGDVSLELGARGTIRDK